TNLVIAASLLMIAVAFAAYAGLVLRWFSAPSTASARSARVSADSAAAEQALEESRRDYRDRLLDVDAHLRLSQALWRAGRPIDSFYVMYAAREIFSEDEFRRAQAEIVVGAGGPAAQARARLKGLSDPSLAIPIHVETARDYPDSPEARDSLEQLSRLASGDPDGAGGPPAELALTALEDLHAKQPKNSAALESLGDALIARGEDAQAEAFAREALDRDPADAGAAHVLGALALKKRDIEGARRWLDAAWEHDASDLYSAAKLAEIYDKRLNDPETALPFYLALYRENPYYDADGEPVETRIREALDARRERLLKGATVAGLGGRFDLDDASLRAQAALRAARFKDPRWIDALGGLLDDDCEIVRRNADYALFEIGKVQPDAVRARRDEWLDSDKPLTRIRALNLFADLDGMNALPRALKALEDPNPGVRAYAIAMVLDHYYARVPQAMRARARALAAEKDPAVVDFVRRFSVRPR
ncbi:MAG: hypothetical protein HKL90_06055, partial [Elusimicrobia bacterium]|nr:hypothetical protein [Elusimicrobiota bacterium]